MKQRKITEATMYLVKTQEAYNQLMIELEGQGYKWKNKIPATKSDYWIKNKENTVIEIYKDDVKDITYRNSELLDIDQVVIDYDFDPSKPTNIEPIKVLFKKDIENKEYIEYTVNFQADNYVSLSFEKEPNVRESYWIPLLLAEFEVEQHNWIVISEDNFLTKKGLI